MTRTVRRFVEFQSETNGARTTPAAPRPLPTDFPTTIHLRLTNTNGTLTAAYSTNGDGVDQRPAARPR